MFKYILIFSLLCQTVSGLPAFPGAEGMGADAIGGRNASATVYIVDTLSDDPGDGVTFREAVEASGPRYVVFEVSGIIDLATNLDIDNPYITIAGQTSPGGIALIGREVRVYTHDVVITHMRFRIGAYRSTDGDDERSFGVYGCGYLPVAACNDNVSTVISYNIVLDHCSFSWGPDNVTGVNGNGQDTTFSWCLIGGGTYGGTHSESNHNLGFFVWGARAGGTPITPEATVSLHHSFIGYNRYRVPENNYNSFLDSVNNVVYFWETAYTHQVESAAGRAKANIIGTYRKTGGSNSVAGITSANIIEYDTNIQANIYMNGVIDGHRTTQAGEQWSTQEYWHTDPYQPLDTGWQRETPWPTTGYSGTGIAVTATTMDATYAASIVTNAGATKCQSGTCVDDVDIAYRSGYTNTTGAYTLATAVDTLAEVTTAIGSMGGTPAAPTDSDNDGMSDTWETSTFGDLDQTANTDYNSNGYSDLEEYLIELGGYTLPLSASTSGTVKDNKDESDMRTAGLTLVIDITGDTLNAFDNTIRAAILAGLNSSVSATGTNWASLIEGNENSWGNTGVVRTDDDTITITFIDFDGDPNTSYDNAQAEVIGPPVIPASALVGGEAITATGVFTIGYDAPAAVQKIGASVGSGSVGMSIGQGDIGVTVGN